MDYIAKKLQQENRTEINSGNKNSIARFLDQRPSASIQLKQQSMMNLSDSTNTLKNRIARNNYFELGSQDSISIQRKNSSEKVIQCKCSICGMQGHNRNNQKFHPKKNIGIVKRRKSSDIFKKHGKKLQGGKFVKTIVRNGTAGKSKVYVYFNEKMAGGKYGVPYTQHVAREMAAHYAGANRLIAAKLETATIGSSTHNATASGAYAKRQYIKKYGSTVGMPKNKSGTPDIRAIAEMLNPTPLGLVDHHGNTPTQDVDEDVSRGFGGSVTDQNQNFRNSTANSLCGSADTAIFADAKKNGLNGTDIEKFKFYFASSFKHI